MERLRATRRSVCGPPFLGPLLLVGALAATTLTHAAGKGEPGPVFPARVTVGSEESELDVLRDLGIDVDAVFYGWARVYLIEEELRKLRRQGLEVTVLPDDSATMAAEARKRALTGAREGPAYHTYETLTADLQRLAFQHPDIAHLVSIGQSVQGRELWMMKITDHPGLQEDEPEVAYIAAMHGDEVVGKELCFQLIEYLVDGYGTDPRVTDLVDGTEIWILPSMNPDGTQMGQRYNAHGVDLNRDFPDRFTDPVDTPEGREPETRAVMVWAAGQTIDLAANMHGGTLVANYAFDNNVQGQPVYSPTQDDGVFVSVSRTYADSNPAMAASNGHPSFDNGICNGADWYVIYGGMQDWSYVWRGAPQVTLEVSTPKWPPASELPGYWADNLESMLSYLERVREGVRGIVTSADGGEPLSATVRVDGMDVVSHADPDVGDFHRLLLPGTYTLEFSAPGHCTTMIENVEVGPGLAGSFDVALEPLAVHLYPESGRVIDGIGGNGWLDPEETADLAVTLRNLGQPASNVFAELQSVGWFTRVLRSGATYPDLGAGESSESDPPHHQVSLSPDVPAGHKIGFALRWTTDTASGVTEPLFLPVGESQCISIEATDVPRTILDHQATQSSVEVPVEMEVYDLSVSVDITHGYVGDLRVELISPAATPVILHNRSGGSTDDIHGTYDDDLAPFEPLSRFEGEASSGPWVLQVRDGATGDTGTLDAWSLEVCGRPVEATPPEMMLRRPSMQPGGVLLEWWPYPGLDSYRVYRATGPSSWDAFVNVTGEDDDASDTRFLETSGEPIAYYLVTGVGPQGEGPMGHFGE